MIGEFALIMSVKEKKAVALVTGGSFIQIKNRNFKVGQRIILEPSLLSFSDRTAIALENTRGKIGRIVDRLRYKGLIIISSLAILIPTSGYAAAKFVPWTCVNMDTGNISIQYKVNSFGEVLSTESLSDEAQTVVDELPPVRYEKVENAIDRAMKVIYNDVPYTEEQEPVTFSISTRIGAIDKTMNAIMDQLEPMETGEIRFEQLDWSETEKVYEKNTSAEQHGHERNDREGNNTGEVPGTSEETIIHPEIKATDKQNEGNILPPENINEPDPKYPRSNTPDVERDGEETSEHQPPELPEADRGVGNVGMDSDIAEIGVQSLSPEFLHDEAENTEPHDFYAIPPSTEKDPQTTNSEDNTEYSDEVKDDAPTGIPIGITNEINPVSINPDMQQENIPQAPHDGEDLGHSGNGRDEAAMPEGKQHP